MRKPKKSDYVQGERTKRESPFWEPLLNLIGEEVTGEFMWMFVLEMETSERVHAYKHRMTRCYVHLSEAGRAYAYMGDDGYLNIPARSAAALALRERPPRDWYDTEQYFSPENQRDWPDAADQ